MTENDASSTNSIVTNYLNNIKTQRKREDSFAVLHMMQEITGESPMMWGDIIGFGSYSYQNESGQTSSWFLTGFAPRPQSFSLYIAGGFEHYEELLTKLGKHEVGTTCLYVNKLADIDEAVLRELVTQSVAHIRKTAVS